MKPLVIFNPQNTKIEENVVYKYRSATRGLVFDNENNIAVLFKDNKYYSLPGGGVEDDELAEKAFLRECKEELGCIVEWSATIGLTIEYQGEFMNITSIFTTRVSGDKGKAEIIGDEDEDELACSVEWINPDDIRNILKYLINNGEVEKRFRYKRDLAILDMVNNIN